MKEEFRRKPRKSLRTILTIWFLLVSLVPLAFLTGYSVIKFEQAIDHELFKRLSGNAREIETILNEYANSLVERRNKMFIQTSLPYLISSSDQIGLRQLGSNWIKNDIATSLTFFSRNGQFLMSSFKDKRGDIHEFVPQGKSIFLSQKSLEVLTNSSQQFLVDLNSRQRISLILQSQVKNQSQKVVGFVEQLIELDRNFLVQLKRRLRLELFFMSKTGEVVVSSHRDFYDYKRETLQKMIKEGTDSFQDLTIQGEPFGFLFYPIKWGAGSSDERDMYLALGGSKSESKSALRNVNYAFYTVVGALIIILVIVILIISNVVIRPLDELVQATVILQTSDQSVEIPIKSESEIGLLTESFNEMSRSVMRAKEELRRKIIELERANKEIRETQSRLIQTSKMSALGQLVAGVAHELNNPIGFIYSNLAQLKKYVADLLDLISQAEKGPEAFQEKKSKVDLEYLRSDLPKLINACEDGARRTRDIVIGLRNFSRLDEAQVKEINLIESIETTLQLLSGELKNRITVHKEFTGDPKITCFANQINQVLMNILANAAQAIPQSGDIWIKLKQNVGSLGKQIEITIQDNGLGMTEETMEKIFDPFFSTKGVGQGTGLGLSISYGIIQRHGGEIVVRSQVGVGTEFTIIVPVAFQGVANTTLSQ